MRANADRFSRRAMFGATLAAVGASVRCVVPLVLVLLGISGAWIANLTAPIAAVQRALTDAGFPARARANDG